MELSTNTMQVLKNFAQINSNFVINPGSTLMTMSEAKNILAAANVKESFEQKIGVYDLNELLGVLGLVDTPNLYFTDNYARVCSGSGRSEVKYYYSDPEMLTSPKKPITMPSSEVTFKLDQLTLNSIKRAAATLGHSELAIIPNDGCIRLEVLDPQNATSNTYSTEIDGEYESKDFRFIINISNLKMIPSNYDVSISKKLISEFSSTEMDWQYWVALEKSSTFN